MIEINTHAELLALNKSKTYDNSLINYKYNELIFNVEVYIQEANFVECSDCIFNEKVILKGAPENAVNFQRCIFEKEAVFTDAKFKDKVRIQSCEFKSTACFDNAKFIDLCDFWNTSFYKKIVFYKTNFHATTVFSRTLFFENVLFTYTLIEAVAIFRGAIFKRGLDLSTAIITGSLSLFDFQLEDFRAERNEDGYETMISEQGLIPEKNKVETF